MGERLVDEADTRAVQDQPGPEVPVRGPANRFVESADFQPAPALHGGESEDEVAFEDRSTLADDGKGELRGVTTANEAAVDLDLGVRRDDVEVGPRGGELTQRLEALWMEHVVGIEDYDEVTGRHAGGPIFRGRLATVLLTDEPNSPGVRFERGSDVVRRAVVANDYFLCGPRLRER